MFSLNLRAFFAAVIAALFLGGCATATGPQFTGLDPVATDRADIYVYRNSAFFASGSAFTLTMDGKTTAPLYDGSYQKIATTPGQHLLRVDPSFMAKKSELLVTLESGKTYFYEFEYVTGLLANTLFIGSSIQPREQAKALEDLKALKRAE